MTAMRVWRLVMRKRCVFSTCGTSQQPTPQLSDIAFQPGSSSVITEFMISLLGIKMQCAKSPFFGNLTVSDPLQRATSIVLGIED